MNANERPSTEVPRAEIKADEITVSPLHWSCLQQELEVTNIQHRPATTKIGNLNILVMHAYYYTVVYFV